MGNPVALGPAGIFFYDGSPGRGVVLCPDCGQPADEQFADHGGACLGAVKFPAATSALGIIRAYALRVQHFSMNDLRPRFDKAGIRKTSRGPALVTAQRNGWIEQDGSVASTDPATKRHRIQTYRSLIYGTAPKWRT